jgi:hypothetical protein
MLIIKIIGITLIILGIISYALTVVKAYIFVTIKPGCPLKETMDKLWNGISFVDIESFRECMNYTTANSMFDLAYDYALNASLWSLNYSNFFCCLWLCA